MARELLPIVVWDDADEPTRSRIMTRNGLAEGLSVRTDFGTSIRSLLEDVRASGDEALVRALQTFDHVDGARPDRLRVSSDEVAAAHAEVPERVVRAIGVAISRSLAFNRKIVERASWSSRGDGRTVGEVARPIESVGLFVPSGKGSFPSVMVQIGAPAVAAGVERIVVVVPPVPGGAGRVDPATLVAADLLGLREVYCLNGPSGIAALAYGTASVPRVAKVVGPGSPAVTIAQLLVQADGCEVAPGLGPTDSAIIADSSADPRILAADLINEAEHGADSSAILVSADHEVLNAVADEAAAQLDLLPEPRRGYAMSSLRNGGLILARDLNQALEVINDYASEHVQLAVTGPDALVPRIRYAGTILLGQWTFFAASNFAIGTPATLPTTGYAKRASGVTAHTFLNRIATAQLTDQGFWDIAEVIEDLADHEGFPAHRASVTRRREVHDRPR